MPVDASSVVTGALKVGKEVYCRIQGISENNEIRQRIEKQVKNLEKIAKDLGELQQNQLPESCNDFIAIFNDSLNNCKRSCSNLDKLGEVTKFFSVHGHKKELEVLEAELRKVCDNLQLAFQQVLVLQGKRIEEAVRQGTVETNRTVNNPNEGVYVPNRKSTGSIPQQIEQPQVTHDESGDHMEVKWADYKNPKEDICYEICYDDEKQLSVSKSPEECMLLECSSEFQIKFGPPKIKLGNVYTIKIRGKNGAGAGKWSDSVIFRFKIGPPNKPKTPTTILVSPTEVQIVAKLSEREENGSFITRCKVEYAEGIDGNSSNSTWSTLETAIKQRSTPGSDVKLKIGSLTPDTAYNFRVRMINSVGESDPSDSCVITTSQLIPGPPQNLRISSKRRDTSIKLRWEEPVMHPQAAYRYKVQKCQIKKGLEWENYEIVEKKSAKITQLKTDTKYKFRVRSVNDKDETGDWSDPIEAETRYGIFGRALGTTGAFFGGTFGGPVIGAVGGGALAGTAAAEGPDSETGKIAAKVGAGAGGAVAGALVGIVAAPLIGAMSAIMVNKKMSGETDDMSPQTSDDENETNVLTAIIKNSNKMSEKLFENK